ncbi:MAG: STAS domain-containing protein [Lachnospiraceae bacterium]
MKTFKENGKLTIQPEGRLDSITAPELTAYIQGETFRQLIVDLTEVSYISSAGLRSLLVCKKKSDENKAPMVVKNPSAPVLEVMKMSGFNKMLMIEES